MADQVSPELEGQVVDMAAVAPVVPHLAGGTEIAQLDAIQPLLLHVSKQLGPQGRQKGFKALDLVLQTLSTTKFESDRAGSAVGPLTDSFHGAQVIC